MCGRARASVRAEAVADAVPGCDLDGWDDRDRYAPRENAAPGAWLPVVVTRGGKRGREGGGVKRGREGGGGGELPSGNCGGTRMIISARWGLTPWFTKPAPESGDGVVRPQGSPYDHFNSRAERVREQPLTRRLFSGFGGGGGGGGGGVGGGEGDEATRAPAAASDHRRGVAVVQGFYEWKAEGKRKQGYYVQLRGGAPMRLAAVWDCWSGGAGGGGGGGGSGGGEEDGGSPPSSKKPLRSFSIITVDASRELSWLHDRQPAVLLTDADVEAWLGADPGTAERALASVGGSGGGEGGGVFEWWPVTHEINSPSYAGADAARDVRKRKASITSFFKASPSPLKRARGEEEGKEKEEDGKGKAAAAAVAAAAGESAAAGAAGGVEKKEETEDKEKGAATAAAAGG